MTSITVYDGNTTIGVTKIYVEENGSGVFLDFGTNFTEHDKYFNKFLRLRQSRGIHDYIEMDFLPRIYNYRKDLIPSNYTVSGFKKLDVKAVLISHMHMDHFGDAGFFDKDLPVVASPITLALLKGMQDMYSGRVGSEIIYYTERALNGLT
ncbi:hypothetical protein LCGC14_1075400 [marine sediment metagenome]|uniref:Metallo-beta-lactamase domain-containing protein n=1 Tax=marine sediment metagenome TaxID=412755 RepID=A0A0F9N495_9ZZZZ|nr:MBL fold metallo-hydrolase [archaeon]